MANSWLMTNLMMTTSPRLLELRQLPRQLPMSKQLKRPRKEPRQSSVAVSYELMWISFSDIYLLVMKLLILFAPFMLYPSNLSQLRLVFPTLQRNESPFTLLGQWLATLGRKIDTAADVQDYMALRLGKFGMLPNLKNPPYILLNQLTPSTLVGEVGIQGWYSSK